MNKRTKLWLSIAACLVVLGVAVFAAVMTAYRWNFAKLIPVKYETNTYQVSEGFQDLSLNTETADILFAPSDDGTCKVVCYELQSRKHTVSVQDGALRIDADSGREWHEYIGVGMEFPKITVYLPEGEYGSLFIEESTGDIEIPKDFTFAEMDISVSTGDVSSFASASEGIKIETKTGGIRVEGVSAGALDLSVSTGKVTVSDVACEGELKIDAPVGKTSVTNVRCKNVTSSGSTGDISLKNVIAEEAFSIERSTGDVSFDGCDAAEIFVKTDTGDVTGSLLTEKVFITQSRIGSIDVPKTTTGGKCEINTATGAIRLDIQ